MGVEKIPDFELTVSAEGVENMPPPAIGEENMPPLDSGEENIPALADVGVEKSAGLLACPLIPDIILPEIERYN